MVGMASLQLGGRFFVTEMTVVPLAYEDIAYPADGQAS